MADYIIKPDSGGNRLVLQDDGGGDSLAIETSQDVNINNGDIYFSTAGKGIVLGATSNVDANTLDDYEEGTWTPVVQTGSPGWGTTITFTGGTQTFTYIKIGGLVQIYFSVAAATSSAPSGDECRITGLPFTSGPGVFYPGTNILIHSAGPDFADQTITAVGASTTVASVMSYAGTGYSFPNLTNDGSTYWAFSIVYQTA